MHEAGDLHRPSATDPSIDRRRVLRQAGVAVGTAWVAPQILSAPAASAATLGPNCIPTITGQVLSPVCVGRTLTITVDGGGCSFFYEIWVVVQGFAAVQVTGCTGPLPSFVQVVPLGVNAVIANSRVEVRIFDSCGPGKTLLATLQSNLIIACN